MDKYFIIVVFIILILKIYKLATKTNKENNLVIHSNNGAEFKSYEYKLLTMMVDVKLSMSRIGKSTNNNYIKEF